MLGSTLSFTHFLYLLSHPELAERRRRERNPVFSERVAGKGRGRDLKIDQKIGKNNTLSGRYIYNWFHDPNPFHSDFLPGGLGAIFSFQRTQGLALSLTSNPSPTMVNELRASVNRTNLFFGCNGTGVFNSVDPNVIDQVGRGADYSLPYFSGFGCRDWVTPTGKAARPEPTSTATL